MLYRDEIGNLIEIVKVPEHGSQFDYLWTARYVDSGPGQGMRFSFDKADIGSLYFPVLKDELVGVSS